MIINMIGPPCAGKSYIATRYTLEHYYWNYASIDRCRRLLGEENRAWEGFKSFIEGYGPCIAESSGLSWRLPDFLKEMRKTRLVYTIAFLAAKEVLYQRLANRQNKLPLPYKLRMDEKQSIDWVLQNIVSCEYPIDQVIRTDELSKDETYNLVSEKIEELRLKLAKEKMNVIQ